MGLPIAQKPSQAGVRTSFDAVTEVPAHILGLGGYGLGPGCYADMVLLQAHDPAEAIRLRATRLAVPWRGRLVAEQPPATARLMLEGRPAEVGFLHARWASG